MSTPAALMLLLALRVMLLPLSVELTAVFLILPSNNITGSNIDAQQQLSLNSAKDINIKAGYNGSLNESYHKTSGLSLAGLVGISSLVVSMVRLLVVKFEAMLLVVALVLALTLLEKRPLALDFICTDLESCTDDQCPPLKNPSLYF
jgi:hypothetical protein